MTTITLGGSNLSTEEQEIEAARELRAFLAEKDVSMIKVSEGDAPPTLVVFDPGRRIGWTAQLGDAGSTGDPEPGAYTISGSYSDRTWASSGQAPLAPPGIAEDDMLGSVEIPGMTSSNSNLQFVEALGAGPLGTGSLRLGTTDPATVSRAVELVKASGLQVRGTRQEPLLISLIYDTTVAVSALFVLLALACTMASLVLRLPERREETRLRLLVGATGPTLVRDRARRELVPVVVGTAAGSGIALAATSLTAASAPGAREAVATALGALAGGALMWLARQATFAAVLPSFLKRVRGTAP